MADNTGLQHIVGCIGGGSMVNPEWDHDLTAGSHGPGYWVAGKGGTPVWFDPDIADNHTYPVWLCTACGHRVNIVPGCRAGDEYIDICPECSSMESFEPRRADEDTDEIMPPHPKPLHKEAK